MLDWVSYRLGDTFMKRYLLIGAICLFGISDCFASGSSSNSEETKQMCASLGFTVSSKALCNNKAFPCPRGNWWKCDETAKVGDIKYSSKSVAEVDGWLLANGGTFDPSKYPELAELLKDNPYIVNGQHILPNYKGVFLRAAGTVSNQGRTLGKLFSATVDGKPVWSQRIESSMLSHKHGYGGYYWNTVNKDEGGYTKHTEVVVDSTEIIPSVNSAGSTETCPVRIAYYPYIYAGQPAK